MVDGLAVGPRPDIRPVEDGGDLVALAGVVLVYGENGLSRGRISVYLQFREEFDLPAHRIFRYFATPAEWAKLYGAAGDTKVKADGWYAVPLKRFPFPLVARNVEAQPDRLVRWVFGGFWRGVGEVQLTQSGGITLVEGFEYVTAQGLWLLATLFEERFMTAEFERIWALGWDRIRRNEQQHHG